jgi:hypothetical protein
LRGRDLEDASTLRIARKIYDDPHPRPFISSSVEISGVF